MLWLPLTMLWTLTASPPEPEAVTFWIDAVRLSARDSQSIAEVVARMVDDPKVTAANRREEADLLVELKLGSARSEEAGPTTGARSELAESQIETEGVSGSIATVELSLVDVVEGATLLKRSHRSQIPLVERSRVVDPMLRASLSDVVDGIERWAASRRASPRDAETFGPSETERQTLAPPDLALRLYQEAIRALGRGYQEAALNLFAEAQPLFKQTGRRSDEGFAWERLGFLMASTGRLPDAARPYAKQAVKIARESGDSRAEARGLVTLGFIEAQSGNHPEALELLQAARRMAKDEGAVEAEAAAAADLAGITAIRGKFESARRLQEEALELVLPTGNRRVEGRLRLAMAVVQSHLDERDRGTTLAELAEVRELARAAGDLALEKDAAFVQAGVLLSTTNLEQLREGEIDAIRALKLTRKLSDRRGEAAAQALLGAFSQRLMRPDLAAEYLAVALALAQENGYMDLRIDTLQLLGEMAPNVERGLAILEDALALRRQAGDLRGEIKTLSDMCRLHTGLGQTDLAEERYREAVSVLGRYAEARSADPFVEDIRESFVVTIKSLLTTRTELPFLEGYLEIRNLMVTAEGL